MDSVIKEGSHDVAWNDPPQFSYSGTSSDKRTNRIGQHSSPYTAAVPKVERPDLEDDKTATPPDLQIVADGLKALLNTSHVDEKKKRDILRRIDTMEKKWSAGSLNDVVMRGVGRVLELLIQRSFDDALKVQTRLSVDWPGLVNPWGVGIKQIILLLQQNSA